MAVRYGRGMRCEGMPIHLEHKAAAIAVLDRHGCVIQETVRYTGTHLLWAVDLGQLPEGDGPAVCEVIRRDIDAAIRGRR